LGKEARLFRKRKGFNLVELLIVVVIIALLTMIVIPSARVSINRARLKTTMKNVNAISRALSNYLIDNGIAPAQNGPYDTNSTIYIALVPFYTKVLPIHDQWGNGFQIWSRDAAEGIYGITNPGDNDFLIASFGRDHTKEDDFTFSTLLPEGGFYFLKQMSDFNKDLVMWNNAWIRRPMRVGD
jgi:general secretion pathway protein G